MINSYKQYDIFFVCVAHANYLKPHPSPLPSYRQDKHLKMRGGKNVSPLRGFGWFGVFFSQGGSLH